MGSAPGGRETGRYPGESPQETQSPYARRGRILGALVYVVFKTVFATLRLSYDNREALDRVGGAIFVTWHGRALIPALVTSRRGWWALISLSRDGEIQNSFFRRMGFQTARGSTGRGGIRGALQMARRVREGGVLVMTPDGPRGPTHKVQLGIVLMAEKSGAPIIPVAASVRRRWLMRSWDAYLIPQPFSAGHFLVGDPIFVPPGLDEAGRIAYARRIEVALNRIEREADLRAGFTEYPAEWSTELIEPDVRSDTSTA